jgi:hypothetical protein
LASRVTLQGLALTRLNRRLDSWVDRSLGRPEVDDDVIVAPRSSAREPVASRLTFVPVACEIDVRDFAAKVLHLHEIPCDCLELLHLGRRHVGRLAER